MASTILISTDQVEEIATSIETLNEKLNTTLLDSQAAIKALTSTWTGDAASATVSAFDSFAATYFQNYYDIIKSYVTFLRQNVSADYQTTENSNVSLADAFK